MSRRDYIAGMCFILPLEELRNTPSVQFHALPEILLKEIDAVDFVNHKPGAKSPMVKGWEGDRPWYMHPDQEDNLAVLHGKRIVELYTVAHGKVETFEVTPTQIKHGDMVIHDGPAILGWGVDVFHRIHSPEGSASINFARHFVAFDLLTNFNIYSLNPETGEYSVLREGHLDQPTVQLGE
jgi:hypothetical protein